MTEMFAMQLEAVGTPLRLVARQVPTPGRGELLIEVAACGVCRTDLHIVDGEIESRLPIVPGHEIVGIVVAAGEGVADVAIGDRVGVPWLGHSCGHCDYCRTGHENLCDSPAFKRLRPEQLVTHRFVLSDILEAYETFARAADTHALKVVIDT